MHFPLTRRQALQQAACGFGALALNGLLHRTAMAADPVRNIINPRAKRVIFIFMQGGPSHVDSFDYKPRLITDDGKKWISVMRVPSPTVAKMAHRNNAS